ncbi:MAG: hypothetical protein U5R31_09895 [Acidimicrobiia bacterium]|nr:hypothetical protein [Acidimicrobiia bacterium]
MGGWATDDGRPDVRRRLPENRESRAADLGGVPRHGRPRRARRHPRRCGGRLQSRTPAGRTSRRRGFR